MSPARSSFPSTPSCRSATGGDSASIDEVDGLVTGIAIKPGRHDVVLTYRPQRLSMLTMLTAAALIVLAVLWLTDRGQDARRDDRPEQASPGCAGEAFARSKNGAHCRIG